MKIPANSLALVNNWRRLKSDQEKLEYLLFIKSERLKEIFSTEISGGLLGDILKVLVGHENQDAPEVAKILSALSSAKRFKLDLQFMSSTEKGICRELFKRLKDHTSTLDQVESTESAKDGIVQVNDLPEDNVLRLATLFEVDLESLG